MWRQRLAMPTPAVQFAITQRVRLGAGLWGSTILHVPLAIALGQLQVVKLRFDRYTLL